MRRWVTGTSNQRKKIYPSPPLVIFFKVFLTVNLNAWVDGEDIKYLSINLFL